MKSSSNTEPVLAALYGVLLYGVALRLLLPSEGAEVQAMTPRINGVRVLTGVLPKLGIRAFFGVTIPSPLPLLNETLSGVFANGVLGSCSVFGAPVNKK